MNGIDMADGLYTFLIFCITNKMYLILDADTYRFKEQKSLILNINNDEIELELVYKDSEFFNITNMTSGVVYRSIENVTLFKYITNDTLKSKSIDFSAYTKVQQESPNKNHISEINSKLEPEKITLKLVYIHDEDTISVIDVVNPEFYYGNAQRVFEYMQSKHTLTPEYITIASESEYDLANKDKEVLVYMIDFFNCYENGIYVEENIGNHIERITYNSKSTGPPTFSRDNFGESIMHFRLQPGYDLEFNYSRQNIIIPLTEVKIEFVGSHCWINSSIHFTLDTFFYKLWFEIRYRSTDEVVYRSVTKNHIMSSTYYYNNFNNSVVLYDDLEDSQDKQEVTELLNPKNLFHDPSTLEESFWDDPNDLVLYIGFAK